MLDEVLPTLPDRYRTPLVCCYLEGRTQEEVAALLGAPLGTVRSWLARGRDLLRQRLLGRGWNCSLAGLGSALLASAATAATQPVAVPLFGCHAAPGRTPGCRPRHRRHGFAAHRSAGSTRADFPDLGKLKVGVVFCILSLVLAMRGSPSSPLTSARLRPTKVDSPPHGDAGSVQNGQVLTQPKQRVDWPGDPLPADAVGRLGTLRYRHENLIDDFVLSADGQALAAVAGHGLIVWDAATGRPLSRLATETAQGSVAFAPDGQRAHIGGADGLLRLVDTSVRQGGTGVHRPQSHGRTFLKGNLGFRFWPRRTNYPIVGQGQDRARLGNVVRQGTAPAWQPELEGSRPVPTTADFWR